MPSTLASSRTDQGAPVRPSGPILVAVGDDGGHVLRAAAALAPLFAEHVHVFSAVEPLPMAVAANEPIVVPASFEEGRREARLEHLGARLAEVGKDGHCWQLDVEVGDPVTSLVRRARELDAALILIGIGHHRPIDRLAGGEMTLRVIRRASCPVLAVAGELEHRPHEVVVATDFSRQSLDAARAVLPLLADGAVLHVVHVWQPSVTGDPTVFVVEEEYAHSIAPRLARFIDDLHLPSGVTVFTAIREGRCAAQLLHYAEEHHADLIVAGRHGLSTFARFFVGSVTTALLRGSTCSVLVMPDHDHDPYDAPPGAAAS
jgi:nucleotide-binding universal stress UspA family protein